MNPSVDIYMSEGCGRCSLGNTPACKVHKWHDILQLLRSFLLDSALTEERKWGVPCYTFEGRNVILLGAFNDNCTLSFLKGALLTDVHQVLQKPGENTQGGRVLRFTHIDDVVAAESIIKAYISEAIEIEKAGLKVEYKANPEAVPEELLQIFEENPAFKAAFEALTAGRQRGYIIHFSQPKQSKTRVSRIEKYIPKIFEGKGFFD